MARWQSFRDRCEMLTPPLPWDRPRWRPREGPPVVLLHGLWRGWHAMEPLERSLAAAGYSTLNIPYPSIRLPIATLADRIAQIISDHVEGAPIHIVAHSLGGIIARALGAAPAAPEIKRIVMLAPPNAGSEIVDWAGHRKISRLLGPAGKQLGSSGFIATLPEIPETAEVAVIMGNRSLFPLFRKLLDAENDGFVSVPRGKIPGIRSFSVVPADHTFIQMHPVALRHTIDFLKTGAFPPEIT